MKLFHARKLTSAGARSRATASGAALLIAAPLAVVLTAGLPASSASAAGVAGSAPPIVCSGNGTDGNRVQPLYLYEPGQDQFSTREPAIRQAVWETQQNVNDSARRDGAQRWLRFLHNNASSNCQVTLTKVQVPAGTLSKAWWEINDTVAALGYNAPRRIYLLMGEGYPGCGDTDPWPMGNTQPGTSNPNNTSTTYSRVGFNCFGGHLVTHELAHALGAVSDPSPNFVGGGHCTDGQDILCQNTTPLVCTDPNATRILDCGRNDYFGVNPQGSWLQTHWNIANDSAYLDRGSSTTAISAIPPVPPQYLAAVNVSGTSVALTFKRPTSSWEAVTDYQIMNGSTVLATIPANLNQRTYTLTGLSTQRTYTLTVRSRSLVSGSYRVSTNSRPLTFTTTTSSTSASAPTSNAVMVLTNDVQGPDGRAFALELYYSSMDEDAYMVNYQRDEGLSQQWRLTSNNGAYNLVSMRSNKCLSVLGSSTASGAAVVQNTCSSANVAQRWQFTSISNGKYQLRNALSGMCIQSEGGSTAEFARLVQSACTTAQATQRWSTSRLS